MVADLDTFFVSCELIHKPHLRGRPVILGKSPARRGIVATCTYEARALGIRTGIAMGLAYKLVAEARRNGIPCANQVVFLHGDGEHDKLHGGYSTYSGKVQEILAGEVPSCRAHSIDEFELDITGCERIIRERHGGLQQFAWYLVHRVKDELDLPISIGVGLSRVVAKMASKFAKPNGVHIVRPEQTQTFLAPQPVRAVPGIGPATERKLVGLGIETVGQLLSKPIGMQRALCGVVLPRITDELLHGDGPVARQFYHAHGFDHYERMVLGEKVPLAQDFNGDWNSYNPGISLAADRGSVVKSLGHDKTLDTDTADIRILGEVLWRLTENACYRLRRHGMCARHVSVHLRYSDFHSFTHGGSLPIQTDADSLIYQRVLELFQEARGKRDLPLRLVGMRLEKLCPGGGQGVIFETRHDRLERDFFRTVDSIRDRFGRDLALLGPGVFRPRDRQLRHHNLTLEQQERAEHLVRRRRGVRNPA
jgi:DNA polymerase-4